MLDQGKYLAEREGFEPPLLDGVEAISIPEAVAISIVLNRFSAVPRFESLLRSEGVPSVSDKSSNKTPMMTPITISAPIILFPPFSQWCAPEIGQS